MIAQYVLGLIFVIIAVVEDIKAYKIRNKLIIIFLTAGLVLSFAEGGAWRLANSALGMIIPLILLPLFALRMIGAGDIKAFCVLGTFFGAKEIVWIMMLSFLSGGIIALGFMIFRKNGLERFKKFFRYIRLCIYMRKPLNYNGTAQKDTVFRFAYAIAAGYEIYAALSICGKI